MSRIRRAAGALHAANCAAWPVCGISWTKATRLALTFCLWPRCIGSVANIVNWRVIGDELGHVLNDSDARVFFIGAKLQSSIELISARIPGFSTHHCGGYGPSQNEDPYESCFVAAISVAADPYSVDADTALVIYSSGLPGWPKGFVLSRRALVNHIKSLVQLFLLGKGDANVVAMAPVLRRWVFVRIFDIRVKAPTSLAREPGAATLIGSLNSGTLMHL
ncbi:hypothetical protein DIJ64_02510 [Mycobacterium leprae]|uniref:AMP-dependent synthetase/ligase domain-containing protein n=1 Tax=Mycobacterium leprae TaxID=1769 RepID=O07158_MYCLR|nr:hypothetical protein DIJ64_02510 [Mycobacterium leprae]CAB09616.1 hypothetical protein MLCL581.30 [Mycobacterium leprae]